MSYLVILLILHRLLLVVNSPNLLLLQSCLKQDHQHQPLTLFLYENLLIQRWRITAEPLKVTITWKLNSVNPAEVAESFTQNQLRTLGLNNNQW